jgi:preprotein translocase SecF subunit
LNDTIVIFDRVRENLKTYRNESFEWVINRSINDCLSRTILTISTTMLAVATLWVMDHGVIADFARTMVIGMVLGAYSTVYVAAPLVILVRRWQHRAKRANA